MILIDPPTWPGWGRTWSHLVSDSSIEELHDFAGRLASETDAMGRRVEFTYFGDDRPHKVVLKNFHNPDGSTRDYVLQENTYDAAGNVTRTVSGDGTSTTTAAYDRSGNRTTAVHDPEGLALSTTTAFDAGGNVTRVSRSGKASNVPWPVSTAPEVVDYVYDDAGNAVLRAIYLCRRDGTYDKHGVFLDKLVFPRFVMPYGASGSFPASSAVGGGAKRYASVMLFCAAACSWMGAR